MRFILIGSLAASLIAGAALAETFGDANNDGVIDEREYAVFMATGKTLEDWDKDGDGVLSPDEVTDKTLGWLDVDNDGEVTQTEAGVWEDSRLRPGEDVGSE